MLDERWVSQVLVWKLTQEIRLDHHLDMSREVRETQAATQTGAWRPYPKGGRQEPIPSS
jgi:hypothetical protein